MPPEFSVDTLIKGSTSSETAFITTTAAGGSIPVSRVAPATKREYASMTTSNELTIVRPAKNEAKLIPDLLISLTRKYYSKMSSMRVLVADANSTDGTPEIVLSFRDRLNVEVIRGGMPSVGRNQGAARADTPYVLFLDADIELAHPSVLRRAVELAQRKQLHCVTTTILCRGGDWIGKLLYAGNELLQYL